MRPAPSTTRVDLRRSLFAGLIDSAAMFPPAQEPTSVAVAGYRHALADDPVGLYGRFLVPAGSLAELAEQVDPGWGIGVVLPAGAGPTDARTVVDGAAGLPGGVASVELRWTGELPAVLEELARLPRPASVHVEVEPARATDVLPTLSQYAAPGLVVGAKLRCGGLSADAFPEPAAVAAFLKTARELDLPTKATQGLHHPFRTHDELTGALQHGFVNLLAALALGESHPGLDAVPVVAEPDHQAFSVDSGSLTWRGLSAGPAEVATARRILVGIGSCSLSEPMADLFTHGLAP